MIISAAKAVEAAGVLGIELAGLTPDALGKAYRNKTKECHPDRHGTTRLDLWARVSWAKECLERWLEQHPPEEQPDVAIGDCRACGGTGRVKFGNGFVKAIMWCIMCDGTGGQREGSASERD